MERPKFDLRRLWDRPAQILRERTIRLRDLDPLQSKVVRVGHVRLRREHLIPVVALLLLVLALGLSAYASFSQRAADVIAPAALPGFTETPAAEVAEVSTIVPTSSVTPVVMPTAVSTETLALTSTEALSETAAYPGPPGTDAPVPLGTPVAGGSPPGVDPQSSPPGSNVTAVVPNDGYPGPPSVPPSAPQTESRSGPALIPTTPSVSQAAPPSRPPSAAGSGYPGPQVPNPPPVVRQPPASSSGYPGPQASKPNPSPTPPRAVSAPPVARPGLADPSSQILPTSKPTTTSLDLAGQPAGEAPATATLDAVETTSTPAAEPTEQAVVAPTPTPTAEAPATADLTVQPTEQASVVATPTPTAGLPITTEPAATATGSPAVTPTVQPTATPGVAPSPTVAPLPSPESATRIEGPTRWERSASPILVERDVLVAPGASLQIDPGVEVRFKPGTSLIVQGQVLAAGAEGTPVRFVATEGRWNGLVGHTGSVITLEYTEVRQAGQNGVALSSTGGQLVLRNVLLTDGGGGIVANGAAVEMRNSQVTGNDLATGPALSIWIREAPVTLRENIIGGNQTPQGTSQVRVVGGGIGPLDVQGNAFVRGTAPLVEIQTSSAMGATIRCNDFREGTVGLLLNAFTPNAEGFSLAVDTNAFERQPVAGITSTVTLEAGNNWWGDQSGPTDAQRNPEGRGVPVGPNVNFQPILEARPDCAPVP